MQRILAGDDGSGSWDALADALVQAPIERVGERGTSAEALARAMVDSLAAPARASADRFAALVAPANRVEGPAQAQGPAAPDGVGPLAAGTLLLVALAALALGFVSVRKRGGLVPRATGRIGVRPRGPSASDVISKDAELLRAHLRSRRAA